MKDSTKALTAATFLGAATASSAATLYFEDFDGNTNGYNPDSSTAMVGDNDWVDFANRMSSDSYSVASGGAETVLAGVTASNDPQVRSDFNFTIPKADIDGFQLRLRIDVDGNSIFDDALTAANFSVLWGTDPYVNPGAANGNTQVNFNLNAPTTLDAQSDGWHLASWSIPSGGLTAGNGENLNSVRIDPINNINGNAFELDSFTITGVPEPASAILIVLGASCGCLRRVRRG